MIKNFGCYLGSITLGNSSSTVSLSNMRDVYGKTNTFSYGISYFKSYKGFHDGSSGVDVNVNASGGFRFIFSSEEQDVKGDVYGFSSYVSNLDSLGGSIAFSNTGYSCFNMNGVFSNSSDSDIKIKSIGITCCYRLIDVINLPTELILKKGESFNFNYQY